MSKMLRTRVLRSIWSALVVLAALPVFVVVPAGVGRADGDVHYGKLWSSFTRVTTSTGRHVLVRVTAFKAHDPEYSANEMHVQVWTRSRTEYHSWFPLGAAGGFDYTSDGYAQLSPATTPFYSVDLQFTPTSKTKTTYCSPDKSQWVRKQTGQLSGMLFVDTHTKKWGTIGSSTREDFVFAPGSNVRTAEGYSYVCGALPEPCVRTIDVSKRGSTEPGDAMLSATSTRRAGTMQGHLRASSTRGTSDSDVRRIDVVSVSAPPLRLHLRNHRATVTITTSDNGATGSGVAKATQEGYGGSVSCGDRHLRSTAWPRARFTNGSTPLTFHTIVFGDIRVADSSHPYTTDVHYYRR